jgi:ATP/ADP translocase
MSFRRLFESRVVSIRVKKDPMLIKIICILFISFFALIGFALIRAGQYLHKEKYFKTGLREGLHNTTIDHYPVHKEGKRLLLIGQILIAIDLAAMTLLYLFW